MGHYIAAKSARRFRVWPISTGFWSAAIGYVPVQMNGRIYRDVLVDWPIVAFSGRRDPSR
jgi:hypothetical protein